MGSVATPIGGADNSATLYTWSGVSAGVVCLLVGTCWCFIWRRRRNLAQQRVWAQIVQSNHKTIASIGERPKIWTSWLDVDAVSEDRSEVDNWMTAEAESMPISSSIFYPSEPPPEFPKSEPGRSPLGRFLPHSHGQSGQMSELDTDPASYVATSVLIIMPRKEGLGLGQGDLILEDLDLEFGIVDQRHKPGDKSPALH